MTDPVILYGTQSTGETLPVQVDATGRLVAEGLQGPPGHDGEGVPEPYGEEGSVLTIKDGIPQWVAATPPEPPLPDNYIALVDERDAYPPQVEEYGLRDNDGSLWFPDDPWDTAIRTLDCWVNPGAANRGLGAKGMGVNDTYTLALPFKLDLTGGNGKVLELHLSQKWQQGGVGWKTAIGEIAADNSNLQGIVTRAETFAQNGSEARVFSFLVNQADIGVVQFYFNNSFSGDTQYGWFPYLTLQSWAYVDPSVYVLKMAKGVSEAAQNANKKPKA